MRSAALAALRRARHEWQELNAPYEVARVRVLMGLGVSRARRRRYGRCWSSTPRAACSRSLHAAPDVARLDALDAPRQTHGLSARELEVLRLVAAGKTNREIAAALVVSEHTVARHVQNIFAKLRVSSRTAAGAFAYEHDLV